MSTITAKCQECLRDIEDLRPTAILMTVYDCDPTGEQGYYSFFCPRCTEQSRCDLNAAIITALKSVGVRTHVVHVPEEALEPKNGPPISPDDILDFHIAINGLEVIAPAAKTPPP